MDESSALNSFRPGKVLIIFFLPKAAALCQRFYYFILKIGFALPQPNKQKWVMKYWLSRFAPLASGWLIVIQLPVSARVAVEVFLGSERAGWEPNTEDGCSEARQRHGVAKQLSHVTLQWENQDKIRPTPGLQWTFCILKGQSWKAIIPTGQQLSGVQHPTRWLFTFYELRRDLRAIFWASVAKMSRFFFSVLLFTLSPDEVSHERVKRALALLVHVLLSHC